MICNFNKCAVIIVDEDPVFCESMKMLLPSMWILLEAHDIKSANILIANNSFDLAIVDMHLLDGSGSEFIRGAVGLPCLLCTQDLREPTFQSIFNDPSVAENIVGYLTKPLVAGSIFSIKAGLQIGRERRLRDRLVSETSARFEDERREIAAALHDSAGASLTQISWIFRSIERLASAGGNDALFEIASQCKNGKEILSKAFSEVGEAVNKLQNDELGVVGLDGAVNYAIDQWEVSAPSVDFSRTIEKSIESVDKRRSGVVYRLFQEGVTNALRHTEATAVDIDISVKDDRLILKIASKGRVFNPSGPYELSSLRERTASLGGVIRFECGKNSSLLNIFIPIK